MIHSFKADKYISFCFRQSHITSEECINSIEWNKTDHLHTKNQSQNNFLFQPAKRMSRKLSGIQKEVLALYRTLLREATKKDRAANTNTTGTTITTTDFKQLSFTRLLFADASTSTSTAHARNEFRRQALKGSRKDYNGIEHKIRHGYKQIKLLQMPGVVTFKSW